MQEQEVGAFVTAVHEEGMPPESTPSESSAAQSAVTSSYATFSENGA